MAALPCVGCGQLVTHEDATVDRDGWWHDDCAEKAWEACGYGVNGEMPAPFKAAWKEAKRRLLSGSSVATESTPARREKVAQAG